MIASKSKINLILIEDNYTDVYPSFHFIFTPVYWYIINIQIQMLGKGEQSHNMTIITLIDTLHRGLIVIYKRSTITT